MKAENAIFRVGIPVLSIIGGLCLTAMFSIGMLLDFQSPFFDHLFLTHLLCLVVGVLLVLFFFVKLLLESQWSWILPVFFFLTFTGCLLLLAFSPVINHSALAHHLYVPKYWLTAGKVTELRWHELSYYPMLISVGYAGLLARGLEAYCAVYNLIYLFLLCGVVGTLVLQETKSQEISIFSFLLVLSTPICIRLGGVPLPDLGLALYFTIAAGSLINWSYRKKMFGYALQAGIALGLTMSCKYAGVLAVAVSIPAFLLLVKKSVIKTKSWFLDFVFIGILAVVVVFPWLIKNALWSNNPFHPLFSKFIGVSETAIRYSVDHFSLIGERVVPSWEGLVDVLILPVQMIAFGQDHNPQLFDGVLTPLLLLALFPLMVANDRKWLTFFFTVLFLYTYIVIFFLQPTIILLMPVLGVAFILTGLGTFLIADYFQGKHKLLICNLLLLIQFVFSIDYCYRLFSRNELPAYYYQQESREHYLRRKLPDYRMIEYINSSLPDDAFIYLLLAEDNFYYYDRQIVSEGHGNWRRFKELLHSAADPASLKSELSSTGIDYLLAEEELLNHHLSIALTLQQKNLWKDFSSKLLTVVRREGGYVLWKFSDPYLLTEEDVGGQDEDQDQDQG